MKNVADIYPLSSAQAGILFHTISAPNSGVYVEQYSCLLTGELDTDLLQKAWNTIVQRNATLRTGFLWEGIDKPLQVVRQQVKLPFEVRDWRDADDQVQRLDAYLAQDRKQGFDVARAPLSRITLLQLDAQRTQMVWTAHHLLLDGWSTAHILREVFACYTALQQGAAPGLPERRPFRDYIGWLQKQSQENAERYWCEQLADFDEPTRLPRFGDQGESLIETTSTHLPADLTAALATFAKTNRLTPNTVLQGAWSILLSRYSREQDIAFGTTVSGRPAGLRGAEQMVGMFINTLPVRVQVDPKATPVEWLQQLQRQQLDLRDFEYSALNDVQKWSGIPAGEALFETLLVFENYPMDGPSILPADSGLEIADVHYHEQSNYPLSLIVVPDVQMELMMVHDCAEFDTATILRMQGHLETILRGLVEQQAATLGDLSLLTVAEREQLLSTWNETAIEPSNASCIHHLIEQHAADQPNATAAVFDNQRLTYGELDARAETLAVALRELGVRPNIPVGICLERSLEMVVAIVGILKAGGGYVPLDPGYPATRLEFMLEDAQVPLVVMADERVGTAPTIVGQGESFAVADINLRIQPTAHHQPAQSDVRLPTDSDLAYIIYTSGSTGTPKGVPITHRNLVHSTTARFHFYDQPVRAFLLLSSFAFDSSVVGIFWTLCQGGALVLPRQREEQDVLRLADLIEQHAVSHTLCLPTLYRALLEFADGPQLTPLRVVVVAGEACPPALVQMHDARVPNALLYNEYGPTEGTVWAAAYRFPRGFSAENVPIGRPIPNTQAYILDANQQPVPIGVAGELYIGGSGIAQGYLNRPDLTAERFVERDKMTFAADIPASTNTLYRTGDLTTYLPNGDILFLGRIDDQVKLRGYRIELGEIESALRRHDGVDDAAVLIADEDGRRQLLAFLVADAAVEGAALRHFLDDQLPNYMVPAQFVWLDAMPHTPNGKLDRKHLLAMPRTSLENEQYVGPRNETESALATIWQAVLGVPTVGIYDNFFELGGDSILSIQIVARARREGLPLRPDQMVAHPTIAALAVVISAETSPVQTGTDQPETGNVPLTPIQHWFFERNFSTPNHWNMAQLVRLPETVDTVALERAVQHTVAQHAVLRSHFSAESCEILEVDAADKPVLLHPESVEDRAAYATEIHASLDLVMGTPARFAYFQDSNQLLIVIHHLVVDVVSWSILIADLAANYQAFVDGRQPDQLTPSVSWAAWARGLESRAHATALTYWQSLAGVPHALPVDHEAGQNRNADRAVYRVRLSAEKTNTLLRDVPIAYNTRIDDALLAPLASALAEWTGRGATLVELEGHGRSADVDLSRTVGWFTSIYPVCLAAEPGDELLSTLRLVKEQLRAVPDRGVGYGLLRYLHPDAKVRREMAAIPAPQIGFNYLGQQWEQATEAWGVADGDTGMWRSAESERPHLISINAIVLDGALSVEWAYSDKLHDEATIKRLAETYIRRLQSLIDHSTSQSIAGFTPADFALSYLKQADLNRLADRYNDERKRRLVDLYPLSAMQSLMLLHAITQPDAEALFTQIRFELRGQLGVSAFRQAWQGIAERHTAVRTGFVWDNIEQPHQFVLRRAPVPVIIHDLTELNENAQVAERKRLLTEDRVAGFDLTQPPLMRVLLFKLAADRHAVVWSSHHLIADRWCIDLVMREVAMLYAGRLLSPAPAFHAYLAWTAVQSDADAETYWRTRFANVAQPTLILPPRHAAAPHFAEHNFALTENQRSTLEQAARRHQVTASMLLWGGWGILLGGLTGAERVVFGVTVSGRQPEVADVDQMVGSLINNVPVVVGERVCDLSSSAELSTWLRDLQIDRVALTKYEHASLENIQRWSGLPAHLPLFDTLLVLQSAVDTGGNLFDDMQLELLDGKLRTNYPLTLMADLATGKMQFVYDSNALSADDFIHDLSNQFITILDALAAAEPQSTVAELKQQVTLELPLIEPVNQGEAMPRATSTLIAARNETEREIALIWATLLDTSSFSIHDRFIDLGGYSLKLLQLVNRLEARFDTQVPLVFLTNNPTVAELAAFVDGNVLDVTDSREATLQLPGMHGGEFSAETIIEQINRDYSSSSFLGYPYEINWRNPWFWNSQLANALPFTQFMRLHQRLVDTKLGERLLLIQSKPKIVSVMRAFHALIDTEIDEAQYLRQGLVYESLRELRHQLSKQAGDPAFAQSTAQQAINLSQLVLANCVARGQGAIVVQAHDKAHLRQPLSLVMPPGSDIFQVGNVEQMAGRFGLNESEWTPYLTAHILNKAIETLKRGGVVFIAGDSLVNVSNSVTRSFHGCLRQFPTGFAELALMMDAPVLVHLNGVDENGFVYPHLFETFETDSLETLVDQFVALLSKMWANFPYMVTVREMQNQLGLTRLLK